MEKENTITDFMKVDHGLMSELLATFRLRLGDDNSKMALVSFKKYKKKEHNHINIEENIIFTLNKNVEKIKVLDVITKQHKVMKEMIKNIEIDFKNKKDPILNTEALQDFTQAHIKLEEVQFYPVLDKMLNQEQRLSLLAKIKEAVIENY